MEKKRLNLQNKFQDFLNNFNSIARSIDYSQKNEIFTKNFNKMIVLVQKMNEDLFDQKGIEIQVCIHKLAENSSDSGLKSSRINVNQKLESERSEYIK